MVGAEQIARHVRSHIAEPVKCDFHENYFPFPNSSGVNAIRLRRQTIQVWAPGVSTSVKAMFCDFSHDLNLRLSSMRRSSTPQAIQSVCNWAAFVESSPEKLAV